MLRTQGQAGFRLADDGAIADPAEHVGLAPAHGRWIAERRKRSACNLDLLRSCVVHQETNELSVLGAFRHDHRVPYRPDGTEAGTRRPGAAGL